MSYEYKEEILDDIGPEPNCNYPSEVDNYYAKINELDHVYAQASKADEYEAKAKAYEKIRQVFKNNPGVKDKKKLWNIYYESFKVVRGLESGETNA